MRPVFIFAPYWMGDFSPSRAAVARHNWRVLATPLPNGTPTERMGALCSVLADEVAAVRAKGDLPVAILGDCTMSIGLAAALQRTTPDFTLVWFDAHGDFNTHQTSPSAFIGGMPLAMLCGRGEQTIVTGAGASVLPEADVILTDARDLDPKEAQAVAQSAINHLPNVANVPSLDLPNKPIYLHFDSDVLHLSDLQAVSYPAKGGPSLETVQQSLAFLAGSGRITAISVTMWNPELDSNNSAEHTVMHIVEGLVEQLMDA